MATDLATDREAIIEVLGAAFTSDELRDQAEVEERVELERRRRSVSVEAVAGDPEAVAALEGVEAEIAALDRRQELRELAEAESANRARLASEAETERKRETARKAKAKLDKERKPLLAAIEDSLDNLICSIGVFAEAELKSERLGKQVDSEYRPPRWFTSLENRLSFRLREVGLNQLDYVLGPRGRKRLDEE